MRRRRVVGVGGLGRYSCECLIGGRLISVSLLLLLLDDLLEEAEERAVRLRGLLLRWWSHDTLGLRRGGEVELGPGLASLEELSSMEGEVGLSIGLQLVQLDLGLGSSGGVLDSLGGGEVDGGLGRDLLLRLIRVFVEVGLEVSLLEEVRGRLLDLFSHGHGVDGTQVGLDSAMELLAEGLELLLREEVSIRLDYLTPSALPELELGDVALVLLGIADALSPT